MANEPMTLIQNAFAQRAPEVLADGASPQIAEIQEGLTRLGQDITELITGLQQRLEQLSRLEAWLAQSPGILAPAPAPDPATVQAAQQPTPQAEPGATPADAAATVPQPRQDEQTTPASRGKPAKKPAAKKATPHRPSPQKTAAKNTTTAKPGTKAKKTADKKKASRPSLHELVLPILQSSTGHPQTAREILDTFNAAHPERPSTDQLVRNALNTLIRKSLIERTKQGSTVMFTAPAAASPVTGDQAQQASATAEQVATTAEA